MKTETLQRSIEKLNTQNHHARQLIESLGNPSEWEATGEVADAGNKGAFCACGHSIRYCYGIRHATKGANHVGSTCIDHFKEINPSMFAALDATRTKLEAELLEAEKAAKRAAADEENSKLWDEYAALANARLDAHARNRANHQRSSHGLWFFAESWREQWRRNSPPKYQRAGDLKKWLTRAIAYVKTVPTA